MRTEIIAVGTELLLGEIVNTGTVVDADPTVELIGNVFFNKAPLHDGAMIMRDGRVYAAGCILPLTDNLQISSELGTRHRAAIGISERSDAVVLIASEETGKISVARKGEIVRPLDAEKLRAVLTDLYNPQPKEGNPIYKLMRRRGMHEKK